MSLDGFKQLEFEGLIISTLWQSIEIDASLFEHPSFHEIFRSLRFSLVIYKVEDDPAHVDRPILFFHGDMHSDSDSVVPSPSISGKVWTGVDDQVRWKFVSLHIVTNPSTALTFFGLDIR